MENIKTPPLTLAEFEKTVITNRIDSATGLLYSTIGLSGEAGEFQNLVKRLIAQCCRGNFDPGIHAKLRDFLKSPHGSAVTQQDLVLELGDNLWYNTSAAHACGVTLEQVAQANIQKLRKRYNA